ncbi:MAG: hypothetical protein QF892_05140, partial [Dehalococcoidales bacterium]|nr:hypothetical protein [Dehalococcoidales bacterium]
PIQRSTMPIIIPTPEPPNQPLIRRNTPLLESGQVKGKKLGHDWVVLSLDYKRKRRPKGGQSTFISGLKGMSKLTAQSGHLIVISQLLRLI